MKSIGIIGFGNMGSALIGGLMEQHSGLELLVMENVAERQEIARDRYNARICNDPREIFQGSDAVILAIKPQDLPALGAAVKPVVGSTPIISIAAGVSISDIKVMFGASMVTRFMPSLAAAVGKSVTSVSFSPECSDDFRALSMEVAKSIGTAVELKESLIPAVIGVSGSGIAFVFEFLNSMAMGGVQQGIPYQTSLSMAMEVMEGAVATLRNGDAGPSEMITRVCSPGGTTIEGIASLHENNFPATVMKAVAAAAQKSRDLES